MEPLIKWTNRLILCLTLCVSEMTFADVNADMIDVAAQRGHEIMKELERRDSGWHAAQVEMTMVLRNGQGGESERHLDVKMLEVPGDGDKTLTQFNSPRDIQNTAFLSYSHARVPDDQWIYMPALKRVKRISSANKSGPFMGSELAYEDISSFELEKYAYRFAGEEALDNVDCFLVDLKPLYEYSGYTRIRYWVDTSRYVPLKIEYFDRAEKPLKVQTLNGYRKYLDRYWRPSESEIINLQTDRSTLLRWGEFDFESGLDENDFSRMALRRGR